MRLDPLFLGCALSTSCATVRPGAPPVTPVEVWRESHDGCTLRFIDALEEAFGRSPSFRLVPGRTPGSLIVTVGGHVEEEHVGRCVKVKYSVAYSAKGENLGRARGHCWEDDFSVCATKVVDRARNAARRMNDTP